MKTHSVNTLNHWTKQELVEYITLLEENYINLEKRFDIQYTNCLKLIDDMAIVNETYKQARKNIWRFIETPDSKSEMEKATIQNKTVKYTL